MNILHQFCELQQLRHGHIRFHSHAHFLHQLGQSWQHVRGNHLGQHRLDEFLLAAHSANITFTITIAHILDSLVSVQMLLSGIKVNNQAPIVIPGVLIIHALLHIQVNTTNGIDDT